MNIIIFFSVILQLTIINGELQCTKDLSSRFDCLPDRNVKHDYIKTGEKTCQMNGCCWSPVNDTSGTLDNDHLIPSCFYPINYQTYTVKRYKPTNEGFRAELEREIKTNDWPHHQSSLLLISAEYINENILRVKMIDGNATKEFKEYEPTEILEKVLPYDRNGIGDDKRNYRVNINSKSPFGIEISRRNGPVIFNTSIGSFIYSQHFKQISAFLSSPHIYGLGEHYDQLYRGGDKWRLFTIWSRGDVPSVYNKSSFNLYGHQPYFLGIDPNGDAYGVLLHNVNAMDIVVQPAPAITYRTVGGVIDFFFFFGPKPDDVVRQLTSIIGRPFLPPLWALGFHLCRYNYSTTQNIRDVMLRNINGEIPLEGQWNDIDYMADEFTNYRDFTINKRYEKLPQFVDEIHKMKRNYVINISPSLSTMQTKGTYEPYDSALKQNLLVMNPKTGKPFVGKVWQNESSWIDFTHPNATKWWSEELLKYHKTLPFDALWIDMNEPYSFRSGDELHCDHNDPLEKMPYIPGAQPINNGTLCLYAKFNGGNHYDIHSQYSLYESKATFESLLKITNGKIRPWVLSRANIIGQGRWSSHWTGDIRSDWNVMRIQNVKMLNFNMYGMPFIGADICGFQGNTTEELCMRWHQNGAFYTFSRNHNDYDTIAQDPLSPAFGPSVKRAAQKSLTLRYRLIPYLYTLLYNAHLYGTTVARPLFFEFPKDPKTYKISDQFLWGSALMISPALYPNQTTIKTYFPRGNWINMNNDKLIEGPKTMDIPADNDIPNMYVRSGHIITLQEPAMTIKDQRKNNFNIGVFPDPITMNAIGELYWDDGQSYNAPYNHIVFIYSYKNQTNVGGNLHMKPIKLSYTDEPMNIKSVWIYGYDHNLQPKFVYINDQLLDKFNHKKSDNTWSIEVNIQNNNVSLLKENHLEWTIVKK